MGIILNYDYGYEGGRGDPALAVCSPTFFSATFKKDMREESPISLKEVAESRCQIIILNWRQDE